MATKSEKIAALKLEFPTLKIGDDEQGYTDLSAAEYDSTIAQWADVQLADEAKVQADKAAADQAATDKAAAQAKLAALGLTADDLKALGL